MVDCFQVYFVLSGIGVQCLCIKLKGFILIVHIDTCKLDFQVSSLLVDLVAAPCTGFRGPDRSPGKINSDHPARVIRRVNSGNPTSPTHSQGYEYLSEQANLESQRSDYLPSARTNAGIGTNMSMPKLPAGPPSFQIWSAEGAFEKKAQLVMKCPNRAVGRRYFMKGLVCRSFPG